MNMDPNMMMGANMGMMNQNMMGNMGNMGNMGTMGNMGNMGNMGMMPNMGNMGMMPNMVSPGMPGMGMNTMMFNMQMNGMMNNMGAGMNVMPNANIDDNQGWNLIFENQNDRQTFNIRISEQKLVKEAISLYKLKSNRTENCKFIFNNKELFPEMKICQSGLSNMSKILVISIQNLKGAK